MKASKEFVEKYYTDDLAEQHSVESQWARQWLKEVDGDSVLNIGCGPQFFDDAVGFGKLPKEIVGIDINETNIEFLRTSEHPVLKQSQITLAKHAVQVDFFVHDIKVALTEFVNRFDTVFASGVLGMFDEKDTIHILSLIYKYLKPDGKFVMVSWGDDRLSSEKFEERNSYNWYWRKGPTPEALSHLLEQVGFTILKKDKYIVLNPEEYEWGLIYGFVARK
jgi:SAM-dependent methyltransferase